MITTLYAGLLGIFYVVLAIHVIRGRYRYKVSLGDGGNDDLSRRIRTHGNFAEYVPFALLLLFLADYVQTSPIIIHGLGILLIIGRVLHTWGLSSFEGPSFGRAGGMVLTFTVILVSAVILIWNFVARSVTGF